MGPVDMTIDAMPDPDIGMRIDLSIDMGGGDVALDMRSVDGSTVSDAALIDARATNDSSIDAMISDTGGADTSTQSADMAPSDASGADAEAADVAVLDASGDLDKEWPSLPQGGAFHCQVAGTSPLFLILCALVLGLRRRR